MESLSKEDLEWGSYLIKQAQICRAEANALEQAVINKLQTKYSLQLQYGEKIDFDTGIIVRNTVPELVKE